MATDPDLELAMVDYESRPWKSSVPASRTQRKLHAGNYHAAVLPRNGGLELATARATTTVPRN